MSRWPACEKKVFFISDWPRQRSWCRSAIGCGGHGTIIAMTLVLLVLSIPVLIAYIFATWQDGTTFEGHARVIAEFRHVARTVGIGSGLLLSHIMNRRSKA